MDAEMAHLHGGQLMLLAGSCGQKFPHLASACNMSPSEWRLGSEKEQPTFHWSANHQGQPRFKRGCSASWCEKRHAPQGVKAQGTASCGDKGHDLWKRGD